MGLNNEAPRGKHANTQPNSYAYDAGGDASNSYNFEAGHAKKKTPKGKIILIFVVALLLASYLAGAIYFMSHFLPNSIIAGTNVGFKTSDEVAEIVDNSSMTYSLRISGKNFGLTVQKEQVNYSIDGQEAAKEALNTASPWLWPVSLVTGVTNVPAAVGQFDATALSKIISDAVKTHNETETASTDATIACSETEGKIVAVKETIGNKLDYSAVLEKASNALLFFNNVVELTDDDAIQPNVFLDKTPQLYDAATAANNIAKANISLQINGETVQTISSEQIVNWITVDSSYSASLNESDVETFAREIANRYNTVGSERKYTRADGKQVTVSGGTYGWATDVDYLTQQIYDAVLSGYVGVIDVPTTQDAKVAPDENGRDWGNRYIDVDITEQHVVMYGDNGEELWSSYCITGAPYNNRATPTGVYCINYKESPSVLIGMENGVKTYESNVTYWMPFKGNSVGLHDASWQYAGWGGTLYKDGYGSHGCVNLPTDKAGELYNLVKAGDVVVVHD